MFRIYRSSLHPGRWVAYADRTGWVTFPAKPHGWDEREPARGLDPLRMRPCSVKAALSAGVPAAEVDPGYVEAA